MPYRRRTVRRKRNYRKRDTVKKVRRTVNKLKRSIEVKNFIGFDSGAVAATVGTTPVGYTNFIQPNISNQNVTGAGIIGTKYHVRGVLLNFHLYKLENTGQPSCTRMVVLWIKGSHGVAPTWADFFHATDSSGTSISLAVHQPFKSEMRPIAKVLYDRMHIMGLHESATDYAAGPQYKVIKKYFKLNKIVHYTSGGINESGRLAVFLVDRFGGAVNVSYSTKMYYDDL